MKFLTLRFPLHRAVCFLTSASMQIDSWYSGFLRRLRYDRSYVTSHAIGLRYFNSSSFAEPKLFRFNYLYFGKNELCVFVCAHIISFCLKSLHLKQQIHTQNRRHLEHKKKMLRSRVPSAVSQKKKCWRWFNNPLFPIQRRKHSKCFYSLRQRSLCDTTYAYEGRIMGCFLSRKVAPQSEEREITEQDREVLVSSQSLTLSFIGALQIAIKCFCSEEKLIRKVSPRI